jgi:hypothetical protein
MDAQESIRVEARETYFHAKGCGEDGGEADDDDADLSGGGIAEISFPDKIIFVKLMWIEQKKKQVRISRLDRAVEEADVFSGRRA